MRVEALRADGGATANGFVMQFQADLLGTEVHVAAESEATALGAAALAGLGVGIWREPDEIRRLPPVGNDVRAAHAAGRSRGTARGLAAGARANSVDRFARAQVRGATRRMRFHTGRSSGSVTRLTRATSRTTHGRPSVVTSVAAPKPTSAPASTSLG